MNVRDIIDGCLARKKSRFAFEMLPPLKGDGMYGIYASIDELMEFDPAYINFTSHRESLVQNFRPDGSLQKRVLRRRPGTVGISAAVQMRYGVPTVPHIICGGNSKYDIEDQLIDLDFLGVRNVLALRGDKLPNEVNFTPKENGYAHASDLVRQIVALNNGVFIDGQVDKCHRTKFSIGVAGYPERHLEAESDNADILALKSKVDAGADYIVTQLFYDNSHFFDFVKRCRAAGINIPIIPGIKPLATVKHLTMLPKTFGCSIPKELRDEIDRYSEDKTAVRQIGTEWAISQSRELIAAGIPILHYYPMGRADNIIQIAKALF